MNITLHFFSLLGEIINTHIMGNFHLVDIYYIISMHIISNVEHFLQQGNCRSLYLIYFSFFLLDNASRTLCPCMVFNWRVSDVHGNRVSLWWPWWWFPTKISGFHTLNALEGLEVDQPFACLLTVTDKASRH